MLSESLDVKPSEGAGQAGSPEGMPPTAAPPKKRIGSWVWVVLVAALCLCVCVVVVGAGALAFTEEGRNLIAPVVAYFISPTPTATATPTVTARPTATATPMPTRTPTPIPIPQECDMSHSAINFGPIRLGTIVILGRHRSVDGFANWVEAMQAYVGMQARVTSLTGLDSGGCPVVNVDVDDGAYYWRIRDMTIVE
jgi:hypothetical protein